MAQFRELAAFAQFGTELDKATRDQLERGQRTTEILKQPQYEPVPLEQQVMIIYAVTNGYLDNVPTAEAKAWEYAFHNWMAEHHPEIGQSIAEAKELSEETETALRTAAEEFKESRREVPEVEEEQ
jgi:F-type H+-transporting ATPase subunit alpha